MKMDNLYMDNYPSSYEQFLKLDTVVSKNVSETQFYKEGYFFGEW